MNNIMILQQNEALRSALDAAKRDIFLNSGKELEIERLKGETERLNL